MSTKEAREESRLLNIAVAFLSGTPERRCTLKVERWLVRRALEFILKRAQEELEEITRPEREAESKRIFKQRRRLEKKRTEAQRKRDEIRSSAVLASEMAKTPAQVAAEELEIEARNAAFRAAGKAHQSVYDSVKIGGRAVGSIWHSELVGLRNKGAFEAALCDSILRHAKPSEDRQVHDMISQNQLAAFVAAAKQAAERAKAA